MNPPSFLRDQSKPGRPLFGICGVSFRSILPLGAALVAVLAAPLTLAQSNYATPLFFTTLAGSPGSAGEVDGKGSVARFNGPQGVAVDANGVVFTGDYAGKAVRKIT